MDGGLPLGLEKGGSGSVMSLSALAIISDHEALERRVIDLVAGKLARTTGRCEISSDDLIT